MNVEIIQHVACWERFQSEKKSLHQKLGRAPKTALLWHGTRIDPKTILQTEAGLNINYAKAGSRFGKGIYFAEKAQYSSQLFYYQVPDKVNTYQLLLCEVLLGDCVEMEYTPGVSSIILTPPFKPDTNVSYDSVSGQSNLVLTLL